MGVQQGGSKLMMKKHHIIDLLAIKSPANRDFLQLDFGYLTGQQITLVLETAKADKIIQVIREAHRDLTIGSPVCIALNVPEEKLLPLTDHSATKPIAGGFMLHYKALCSFYKIQPSRDVIQYIQHLFEESKHEIDFRDCPGTESDTPLAFDLRPVFQSLPHNNYFNSIVLHDTGRKGLVKELGNTMKRSSFITRLDFNHITSGLSQLPQIFTSLSSNPTNALMDLMIRDVNLAPSVGAISEMFANMSHGFRRIQLVKCRLNGKQISSIIQDGLMKNYPLTLTLEELNLSGNKFDVEGETLQKLFLRIGPFSKLRRLILRKCSINLLLVIRPLHSFPQLSEIDFSYNKFDTGITQLLCSVLEQSKVLKTLALTGCGLSSSLVDPIGATLGSNNALHALKVVLSDNTLSDQSIAMLMKGCHRGALLHTLDLSQCRINEAGFLSLCSGLQKIQDSSLDTLLLNNTKLENVTQKTGEAIANALVALLDKQDSIRSLSLSGGYSNLILFPFLEKLFDNQSLLELNISGNRIGDVGASTVATLIRKSSYIASITCGNNHIQLSGLRSLALSIKTSKTLQFFDYQWETSSKTGASTYQILAEIQGTLAVNRSHNVHPRFGSLPEDILSGPTPLPSLPQEFLDSMDDEELASFVDLSKAEAPDAAGTNSPVLPVEAFAFVSTSNESIESNQKVADPASQSFSPQHTEPPTYMLGEPPAPHGYTASSVIVPTKVPPPSDPDRDTEEETDNSTMIQNNPVIPLAGISPPPAPGPPPPAPGPPHPPSIGAPSGIPKPPPKRAALLYFPSHHLRKES
eukprot:CAMPEP_0206182586 /NCGR_PEP_ID=MMETSP0166-20121206/147_1 /ASSEMBLY_ACC=CAM_ASM_000260 /TAXON_ID=95228 /ORGANISM="Vannella robusta, Strain DIVA3 518/3/11/1/6" /LENGTH=805 /DNA_ID=CAMNT_0053597311 /DNA_START=297 /DNA_END=2714 /DNA_ORIENTATION=+